MQAIVMHETGGPEVLRLEDVEDPSLDDGQVLVRVRAASVNPIDGKIRSGVRPPTLPKILGNDISGIVEDSRDEGFRTGDEVFGITGSGGYAELAIATAATIAKKPAGLSHAQAAALPVAGLTAWQALFDRGALQRGQQVLIAGATGGVGHLALQFATHAGAPPIALGSAGNRELALSLGAESYVDYTSEDVAQVVHDVDLALDTVGGVVTAALLATVRRGGRLVTIAGAAPESEAAERGATAELLMSSPNPQQLDQIAALVVAGDVRVEIEQELALADAARAHELIESGHTRGKIVLNVSS